MANPGHAKLSPSKAHTWMACPGSIRMSEGLPDEAGEAARQGTACHMLLHDLITDGCAHSTYTVDGYLISITNEMRNWVIEVSEWVDQHLPAEAVPGQLQSEVALPIGSPEDDCWGTADIVINTPEELIVGDAKFGFNEVEVHENPQLLCYLLGALYARAQHTKLPPPRTLRIAIIQPRCGPPKEEVVDGMTLKGFAADLCDAIAATKDPNAPLHASEQACHWCPAAAVCPENQKLALAIARNEFPMMPERLTPEQVAEILHKAKAIKQAVAAVEEHALNELQLGRLIPGWKRVAANTKRQWREDAEKALMAVAPIMDWDPKTFHTEPELKSPAQLEKTLKLKPGGLDAYTLKPEGGPVLVPDSDPRPALKADFETVEALPAKKE